MKHFPFKCIAVLLISVIPCTSGAQQTAPLSRRAAAVRQKAGALKPNAPITVLRIAAENEYGRFQSSDQEGFSFYDIDGKTVVTLKYAEVRKIKDGYGGYNSMQGKHTDRTKNAIVIIVAIGALGALIGAVASAKN